MSRNIKTKQLKSKTKTRLSTEIASKTEASVTPTTATSKEATRIQSNSATTSGPGTSTKSSTPRKAENTDKDRLKSRTSTKTAKPMNERKAEVRHKTTVSDSKTANNKNRVAKLAAPSSTSSIKKLTSTSVKSALTKSKTNNQSIRANQSSTFSEIDRRKATSTKAIKKPATKPNAVLDTYHNVTVTSPPTKRRAEPLPEQENTIRPRTSTLNSEEVIILKDESAKCRSEQEVLENFKFDKPQEHLQHVKNPIAFEINFESAKKSENDSIKISSEQTEALQNTATTTQTAMATTISYIHSDEDYADDFESYESDFESGSSTQSHNSVRSSSTASEQDKSNSLKDSVATAEKVEAKATADESDAEESELTQFPMTVIQRDKEHERGLDSGNYEMNNTPGHQTLLAERLVTMHGSRQAAFDESLDTFSSAAADQLDSGLSSYGHHPLQNQRNVSPMSEYAISYGGYVHFNTRPVRTERGLELMSKIQFDVLSFTLLDLKPISYDVFMQTFGKLNTMQSSTQTERRSCTIESQTDDCEGRTMWTQHPPQYDWQTVQTAFACGRFGGTVQNCCGELPPARAADGPRDQYDISLQRLSQLRVDKSSRIITRQMGLPRKPVDCERLNQFLLRSSLLMSRILNANNALEDRFKAIPSKNPLSKVSAGYRQIDAHFLNALHVVHVFANAQQSLLLTVHACLADAEVYSSEFSNLLMVWSTTDTSDKPLRLLSTWSDVCCAEICQGPGDVVVCGLKDGSIALWDLRETYSFCSKLDGYRTHFAATQSIAPVWSEAPHTRELVDMGHVVDIKTFRASSNNYGWTNILCGYKPLQFVTLHDGGILTIWTLVETGNRSEMLNNPDKRGRSGNSKSIQSISEFSSPWARMKLTQSTICDLRYFLQRRTLEAYNKFERTKSLFQRDIYNDVALRELNDSQAKMFSQMGSQDLRFNGISVGCERIYVGTSRNFILACSKSLKLERFEKIRITESPHLFSTCLRVLSNEDFLAVGLSNGSVVILNCSRSCKNSDILPNHRNEGEENKAKEPPNRAFSPDLEIGKSCVIQNIILNERRCLRSVTETRKESSHELRPSTTSACLEMINEQKKPFELRVYDQEIILSGSMLRKHLVHSLEMSSDGWKLFALSDGEVRIYDFFLDQEVTDNTIPSDCDDAFKVSDIAVAKSSQNEQHLLLLMADNNVHLHLLKG